METVLLRNGSQGDPCDPHLIPAERLLETHSDHAVARGVDQAGGFTQAEGADLPEFEHQITVDVCEHRAPIYLLSG